ncbi:MAG TPA: hypothetical protein VKB80_20810 [Kofleriaceae bacterium]|nr:hypothetical protein [Kofleriaceae bacterium]
MLLRLASGAAFAPALLAVLVAGAAACTDPYECADACAKVYDRCGSAVEVQGFDVERQQCDLLCEEGRGQAAGGADSAALWLDCVQDSVCPGQAADQDDRDLRRYDVTWCNPEFEILIRAM